MRLPDDKLERLNEHAFLSRLPAQAADRRLAFSVVLFSLVVFLAAAPFAKHPLAALPTFLPLYQSALVVNELITAVLLLGQFGIVRTRALLVLASGYLFSALMAVAHGLSFPELFAGASTLGVGSQTTAWLYFLWHGGFSLFVLGYAALKPQEHASALVTNRPGRAAGLSVAAVVVLAGGLFLLATAGQETLPVLMQENRDAPAKFAVATGTWVLGLPALAVLWRRRPHSLLDLWMMVVMCVWIFDVALSAVLNHARYDLGWYAGRVYGLLAGSFVLVVLLLENGKLYASLARAHGSNVKRLQILGEIDRAVAASQRPDAIAGAMIEPLRALLGVPRAIVNIFDLRAGEVEWLAAAGRHHTRVGPGIRYSIRLMGDAEALKRGEPQVIATHALAASAEKDALLASGVEQYVVVPMIAGGELIGAISFGGPPASFTPDQVQIAREVATQLAIAVTQARLYDKVQRQADELEQRVRERTAELQAANRELESFSYSVSHDLRAPLRAVDGYARMLEEDSAARLDDEGRRQLAVIRDNSRQMGQLIDDLLAFSRLGRQAMVRDEIDMTALASEALGALNGPGRVAIKIDTLPSAFGDRALMKLVWINLLSNAIKYSGKREAPEVAVSGALEGFETVYRVRDNGAGFDMRYADKLFGVFQRLHHADEFPGTGVGLANVQRIVARHGGRVWAEGRPEAGATFSFSLPAGKQS